MTRGAHRGAPRRSHRVVRALAAVVTSGVLLLAVAVAVSAVMSLGAGVGTATSATSVAVTLSPGAGGVDLKPGGRGRLRLTATNPRTAAVAVRRLVLDTSRGTGGFVASGSCPASTFSYAAQDNGGRGWSVPARAGGTDGSLAIDLPTAVAMSGSAPDSCQSASVTVYLRAQE